MSDTPRTSEARKKFLTDLFSGKMMNSRDAWAVAEQLERKLAEAKKDILRYQYLLISHKNPTPCILSNELRNKIDKAMKEE